MNKLFISLIVFGVGLLSSALIQAQTATVYFYYDDAGNRTDRITVENTTKSNEKSVTTDNTDKEEDETGEQTVTVFPNPVTSALTVKISGKVFEEEVDVVFSDISGKVLKQISTAEREIEIDVRDLACGTYFISVVSDNKKSDFTIIKEN